MNKLYAQNLKNQGGQKGKFNTEFQRNAFFEKFDEKLNEINSKMNDMSESIHNNKNMMKNMVGRKSRDRRNRNIDDF
jgi:hypothetical protein